MEGVSHALDPGRIERGNKITFLPLEAGGMRGAARCTAIETPCTARLSSRLQPPPDLPLSGEDEQKRVVTGVVIDARVPRILA
jgi:hypothetical protein